MRKTGIEAMTTRRGFLIGLAAAGTVPRVSWAEVGSPSYLAAAAEGGDFALYGLAPDGTATFRVPLPARGHAGAAHPTRAEAVAFARRPGHFALVIDCATGAVQQTLVPPDGRQFNGHGVFAEGGALLCTSEQASDTSDGFIGLWDVAGGYHRIGEIPSSGLGPHDLRLMPDGQTVVVANGGIATDPTDRTKLNIATMRPNLSYLTLSGTLVEQVELDPDLHQNSIRHLAVRRDGLVGFAMQWEGDAGAAPALLGLHLQGQTPILAAAPLPDEIAMQGYAGSISFCGDGSEVAITSPRGGRIHRFDQTGRFLGQVSRADVCGLAPQPDGYLASDGLGGLIAVRQDRTEALSRHTCAWDNHIITL